ncbi:hypothetical protein BaRGS_00011110 [Batillaria attramentaria]|uniref:Uncharacterized protein n=1 Tax=Batillaria attramentaria TaxID=370345 RepID=A0ABD0LE99_9CAEN
MQRHRHAIKGKRQGMNPRDQRQPNYQRLSSARQHQKWFGSVLMYFGAGADEVHAGADVVGAIMVVGGGGDNTHRAFASLIVSVPPSFPLHVSQSLQCPNRRTRQPEKGKTE